MPMTPDEHARAAEVLARHEDALRSTPGVRSLGIGYKSRAGTDVPIPSIVVYVAQKSPIAKLSPDAVIPEELDGVPTDVVEADFAEEPAATALEDASPYEKIEPLVGGTSIRVGHKKGLGTLGLVVRSRRTGELFGVTNRHVAFGFFTGIGSTAFQPGHLATPIGEVTAASSKLDCAAIALDTTRRKVTTPGGVLGSDVVVDGTSEPAHHLEVVKFGARTGRTTGRVKSWYGAEVTIERLPGTSGEISDEGDSGSVWLTQTPEGAWKAVALHWGGVTGLASAKAFAAVLDVLGL